MPWTRSVGCRRQHLHSGGASRTHQHVSKTLMKSHRGKGAAADRKSRDLNRQAIGTVPSLLLRAVTPIMRCVGILDEQDKDAPSSLFAISSGDFKAADSGGVYVVLYAVIGTPSKYAQDPALATKSWEWTETQLSENGLLSLDSMPR